MDGDLVLSSHQVDFGEDGTTEKLVGVVMDMLDGVAVGNGTGIEGSVIATGTPPVVLFGYDVERRRPRTLGAASCAVPQHGVELGFGDSEPIRCQSPWSAGDRWARYSPDVVDSIMRTSRWTAAGRVRSGNSARRLSISVPPLMVLTLGISALAAWANTDSDMTPSSSRFRQFTKRPKWKIKSTQVMGCVTLATTNRP
jgi:hypothetical protein